MAPTYQDLEEARTLSYAQGRKDERDVGVPMVQQFREHLRRRVAEQPRLRTWPGWDEAMEWFERVIEEDPA